MRPVTPRNDDARRSSSSSSSPAASSSSSSSSGVPPKAKEQAKKLTVKEERDARRADAPALSGECERLLCDEQSFVRG